MKTILSILLMTLSITLMNAQLDDLYYQDTIRAKLNLTTSPGDELITFAHHTYGGWALTGMGTLIMVASTQMKQTTQFMIAGSILSLSGIILQIEAVSHVKRAGLLLNENGVGIRVKIP